MGGQTIGSNLGTKTQHISNNKDNLHSTYVSSVQLLGSGTYCWIKEFEPKENRHQKTLKKIGGRDPLLVTDSHKSSGANGRTNVLCFLYDVVSKRALLFAILDQTTIYYMRLCVKMWFVISDFASKYDLVYTIFHQNAIYYIRFYIKMRFIISDIVSKCEKCNSLYATLCQNAIHHMRFGIEMKFIIREFVS